MAQNAFGFKVGELRLRRGIDTEEKLADKLGAMGYGENLGVKHVKHKMNRAFQSAHIGAIEPPLFLAIVEGLELNEDEEWELYQAYKGAARQAWQDNIDNKARISIQSGSKMHKGGTPFYA